ncbi:hypothetical protein SLA2020_430020 [Shorea laevis]
MTITQKSRNNNTKMATSKLASSKPRVRRQSYGLGEEFFQASAWALEEDAICFKVEGTSGEIALSKDCPLLAIFGL